MERETETTRAEQFLNMLMFLIIFPTACLMIVVVLPLVTLREMLKSKKKIRDPQKEGSEILRRFLQEREHGQRSS